MNLDAKKPVVTDEAVRQVLSRKESGFPAAGAIALSFRQEDPARLYLEKIGSLEPLSEAEEQMLAGQAAQGNGAAREKLMEHNLLRVVSIAREYIYRGLTSLDLIQEGNEALEKAIGSYAPGSIYPFNAYASWRIRQAMANALKNYTCITRIPGEPMITPEPLDPDLIQNPAMLRRILEQRNGCAMSEEDWMILAARFCPCGHRPLTLEELGAMMGIPRQQIRVAEYRTVRGRHIRRSRKIRDFYTR